MIKGGLIAGVAAATLVAIVTPAEAKPAPVGSLRVVITGEFGGTAPTVTVKGRKVAKTLTSTKTLKRLRAGKYRVTAGLPTSSLGTLAASPSRMVAKVRKGKRSTVTVAYSLTRSGSPTTDPAPIGPVSPPAGPSPSDTTAPASPTNALAVPDAGSINLSWTNPTDPDLDRIVVRKAQGDTAPAGPTDGQPVGLASATATSVTVADLPEKTTFSFAVFAQDVAGNTSPGLSVSATTLDKTAPGPVSGLTATPDETSVALSWSNPADADLDRIVVRRVAGASAPATPTDGTGVGLASLKATSVTDSGLSEKSRYSYAVFALDAAGNFSRVAVTTTTLDKTAPGQVTSFGVVGSTPLKTDLAWVNPTDPDFSHVVLKRLQGLTAPQAMAQGTSVTLSSATTATTSTSPFTTYSVSAFAVDTSGNVSAPVSVTFTSPNGPGGGGR